MVVGTPIKLNLIPSGVMPVVYINQGDAGYDKEFLIYNGDTPYNVPAGVSATIRGKKADGYGVTEAAALTEGSNLVTVTITEQMVAAAGANLYELVFVDTDGLRIATINMIWAVKADAMGDAVISESDLDYASQVLDQLQSVKAYKNQLDTNTEGLATETAARIAADNTLRASISSEATTRFTTDTSLQAQINQLVSPSGSAPSESEVLNGRIGANGVTYSTIGDAIRANDTLNKKQALLPSGVQEIPFTYGAYILIDAPTSFTPVPNSSYKYAIVDCTEGDVFTINGSGAPTGNARLWGFTKADGTYVLRSGINLTGDNLVITAPAGAEKFIINDRSDGVSYYGVNLATRISDENTARISADNAIDDSVGVVTGNDRIDMVKGHYYAYNASVIDISAPLPYSPWDCALVPCIAGDVFTINGTGSSSIRLWMFVKADGTLISASNANAVAENKIIEAPADTAYLVINDNSGGISYHNKLATYRIDKNKIAIGEITGNPEIEFHYGMYINVYSSPVDLTPVPLYTHKYAIVDCSAGDKFTVNGTATAGSGSDRVWCFIDANNVILTRAGGGGYTAVNELLVAPENAAKLIICDKSDSLSYYGEIVDSRIKTIEQLKFVRNTAYSLFRPYKCRMKAHRGQSQTYVQNTIRAFTAAAEDPNFYAIETDIRATSDGVLICYHDNDLSTLTNGSGVIDFTPWETVSQAVYDYGGPTVTYPDEHIPLFSDYLKICRKYGKVPYIEIKTSMKNENLAAMVDMIDTMGFTGRCVYTSQSLPKIKALRSITDEGLIEYCVSVSDPQTVIDAVESLDNIYIGVPVTDLTEAMVNTFHDNGYLVDAFDLVVGDQNTYDRVIEYGVEGFLVNSLTGLTLYGT